MVSLGMNHMYRAFRSSHHRDVSTTALLQMALQSIKKNYFSSKELADPQLSQGQEVLLQNMQTATEVYDLLLSVRVHHELMNKRHLMQAFRTIFTIQKSDGSNMSNGEIIESTGFRVLCEILKNNIRTLEINEILDAVKIVCYLGVQSSSKLLQILLHMLAREINNLSLQQLLFFDFLLKDLAPNPIVEALKIAIPLVVENNLKMRVDRSNILLLSELLLFAVKKNLSVETQDFLVDNIVLQKRKIEVKSCKKIIRAICDMKLPRVVYKPLFHHSINVFVDAADHKTYKDFSPLVSKLALRYSAKNCIFYHEELLDTAVRCAVNDMITFGDALMFQKRLSKFGHVSIVLLDYLANIVAKEPHLLVTSGISELFALVHGFAQADYCPDKWSTIEPAILQTALFHLTADYANLPWAMFVKDLCVLHSRPQDIISRLFSSEFLDKYLSEGNNVELSHLLAIQASILSSLDDYSGPLLPKKIVEKTMQFYLESNHDRSLKEYLSKALSCEGCVIEGIFTSQGQAIDYLILFDKDRCPISASLQHRSATTVRFVEELPQVNEAQRLAVLYMPRSCYTTNTNLLNGPSRMAVDSLANRGFKVAAICSLTWEQLSEHEKISYIQQKIETILSN